MLIVEQYSKIVKTLSKTKIQIPQKYYLTLTWLHRVAVPQIDRVAFFPIHQQYQRAHLLSQSPTPLCQIRRS